jgi:NADH-quinone oxidoreductase E subunit
MSTTTQADAAGGIHPGPTANVADWSPYATRDGNFFDGLYTRLRPECDAIIAQYEDSRSALLPLAHLFQEHEGYLSPNAIVAIAHILKLPPAVVESTVSFYTLFYRKPVGKYMLQVCRNLSCIINGAEEIMAYFREKLGSEHLETTADGLFSYEEVECLAACDRAPCMQINLEFFYDLTKQNVDDMLAAMRGGTFEVKPLVQTVPPDRTWKIAQDTGRKSSGGVGVSNPNNAGGIGDTTGVIMLDRFVADPSYGERSRERLTHEKNLHPDSGQNGHH